MNREDATECVRIVGELRRLGVPDGALRPVEAAIRRRVRSGQRERVFSITVAHTVGAGPCLRPCCRGWWPLETEIVP